VAVIWMIDLWATMILHPLPVHQVAMFPHLTGHPHPPMINLQCETLTVLDSHNHRIPIIDAGNMFIVSNSSPGHLLLTCIVSCSILKADLLNGSSVQSTWMLSDIRVTSIY